MNKKIIINLSILTTLLLNGCNNNEESEVVDYQSKIDQAYLSIKKQHPDSDYDKIVSYTVKGKKVCIKFKLIDKLTEENFDDEDKIGGLTFILGLPICNNTEAKALMGNGITVEFSIVSETRKKYVQIDCKEVDKKIEEIKKAFSSIERK